jgi:hypothetical protein
MVAQGADRFRLMQRARWMPLRWLVRSGLRSSCATQVAFSHLHRHQALRGEADPAAA